MRRRLGATILHRKTLEMFGLYSLSPSHTHNKHTHTRTRTPHAHRSLSTSSPFQRLLRDPLGSAAKSRTTTLSFRNRCERYALIGLIGFTSVHMSFDKCTAHHRLPLLTTAPPAPFTSLFYRSPSAITAYHHGQCHRQRHRQRLSNLSTS